MNKELTHSIERLRPNMKARSTTINQPSVDQDSPSLKTIPIRGILVARRAFQVLAILQPNRIEWYVNNASHAPATSDKSSFGATGIDGGVLTMGSVVRSINNIARSTQGSFDLRGT